VRRARGDISEDRPPASVEPIALEFFDSNSLDFLRERKAEEDSASSIPELPRDAAAAVLFEQEYTEELLLGIYEGWETLLTANGSSMENTWGGMEAGDLTKLKALRHSIAEEVNNAIARAKAMELAADASKGKSVNTQQLFNELMDDPKIRQWAQKEWRFRRRGHEPIKDSDLAAAADLGVPVSESGLEK